MENFQEARAYYEAAKPADYREGDSDAVFNEALLQNAVNAYQQAIDKFKGPEIKGGESGTFLAGVEQGRYDDFPQRPMQVEACVMNQALSHEKLDAWGQARDLYKAILPESENYQRAQLLIAQSLVKEGKNSEAVAHYQLIMDALDTGQPFPRGD